MPFVILLLALLAFTAPAYAQGATLRYRWTKGDSLTYRLEMHTNSLITGMPGLNDMKIDQGLSQMM